METIDSMDRRSFLAATAGAPLAASLGGCSQPPRASMPTALEGVDPERQLPVPSLGDGDVSVDVYEDLGCPACHEFETEVFPTLEADVIGPDATYRHFDFVVGATDESVAMANAARAVQDRTRTGNDPNGRFFAYKRAVMDGDEWDDDGLARVARSLQIIPETVSTALDEETYYPTLAADWNRGAEVGVVGTPTVVVDGDPLENPFDVDGIRDAVEDAG